MPLTDDESFVLFITKGFLHDNSNFLFQVHRSLSDFEISSRQTFWSLHRGHNKRKFKSRQIKNQSDFSFFLLQELIERKIFRSAPSRLNIMKENLPPIKQDTEFRRDWKKDSHIYKSAPYILGYTGKNNNLFLEGFLQILLAQT